MTKEYKLSPSKTITGSIVSVPGSKSITNRALIAACLSQHKVTLKNVLLSQDTQAMIDCLIRLGFEIRHDKDEIRVANNLNDIKKTDIELDANQSGTSIRFLTALCCLIPGKQTLTGKKSLLSRPIQPLVDALSQLGADIEISDNAIVIKSETLQPGAVYLDASLSSQFLTSIMLIAPVVGLEINITGELASASYIDITKKLLNDCGVQVNRINNRVVIPEQDYLLDVYTIEADASAACYFWALAALTGREIEVRGVERDSLQGDMRVLDIVELYGAKVELTDRGVKVIGSSQAKSVNVDMSNCPDQIQTIAVLAAFADGVSRIAGIETLKHKETDRLTAIITELSKMGIDASVNNGVLSVTGGYPKSAIIDTYDDHRTAMSFALAGAKIEDMIIKNPDVVNKTFPEFWDKLAQCGVEVQ